MGAMTRNAARISIPVALFAAIAAMFIWLSGLALANEHRITRNELTSAVLLEVREDVKDIKHVQLKIMLELQHIKDTLPAENRGE